jgi:hypothetical protein
MLAGPLQTWITRQIAVRQRLERICTRYLLFLMVATTKHSLEEAARFSGRQNLKRAQELTQAQRQLDQLRQQEASRPGLAAQPRAQQLNETQRQLDQLKLEQQLKSLQHELKLNQIEREANPLRRQEQLRELQLQQQMQFLQDQSRTKLMQQDLNRLR